MLSALKAVAALAIAGSVIAAPAPAAPAKRSLTVDGTVVKPKVMIISMVSLQ